MESRPLDALNKSRGKRVIVELKNNKQYIGTLQAFDIHINVVLDDAEERANGELVTKDRDSLCKRRHNNSAIPSSIK